ncbi:MAG: nucleotide excision repair endonuclease [Oceanicaulis sp.]|nr:nucleotide excision repair endonuclease [Oceanicaulis sp.]
MDERHLQPARNALNDYQERYQLKTETAVYALTEENWRDEYIPFRQSSGCYLFYDEAGQLLYVGKAVNLGARVGSYFNPSPFAPKPGHVWSAMPHHALVIRVENFWEAPSLEEYLINALKPADNTRGRNWD